MQNHSHPSPPHIHLPPAIGAASRAARFTALLAALSTGLLAGCAAVPQAEREFLSDPIMQRHDDALEGALESHDFPRREGSVGGSSGSGGGCGC